MIRAKERLAAVISHRVINRWVILVYSKEQKVWSCQTKGGAKGIRSGVENAPQPSLSAQMRTYLERFKTTRIWRLNFDFIQLTIDWNQMLPLEDPAPQGKRFSLKRLLNLTLLLISLLHAAEEQELHYRKVIVQWNVSGTPTWSYFYWIKNIKQEITGARLYCF